MIHIRDLVGKEAIQAHYTLFCRVFQLIVISKTSVTTQAMNALNSAQANYMAYIVTSTFVETVRHCY